MILENTKSDQVMQFKANKTTGTTNVFEFINTDGDLNVFSIDEAGNISTVSNAIKTASINNDAVTAPKVSFIDDDLTVTDRSILVSNGTHFTDVLMSGDATLANDGTLTIANNAINAAKISAGSVEYSKLNTTALTSGIYLPFFKGLVDTSNIYVSGGQPTVVYGTSPASFSFQTNRSIITQTIDPDDEGTIIQRGGNNDNEILVLKEALGGARYQMFPNGLYTQTYDQALITGTNTVWEIQDKDSNKKLLLRADGKVLGSDATSGHVTENSQLANKAYVDSVSGGGGLLGSGAVIVASANGDFTTIQGAIESIKSGANAGKVVIVYPGLYTENLFLYDGIKVYGQYFTSSVLVFPPSSSTSASVKLRNTYNEYVQQISAPAAFFPGTVSSNYTGASRKEVTRLNIAAFTGATELNTLGGKYFILNDKDGSVVVWFQRSGADGPPGVGDRQIEVDIQADANQNDLALSIETVLNADSQFAAVAYLSESGGTYSLNDVQITNVDDVNYADSADGDSGIVVSTLQQGATATNERNTQTIDFTGLTHADFNTGNNNDAKSFVIYTNNKKIVVWFNYNSTHTSSYTGYLSNTYVDENIQVAITTSETAASLAQKTAKAIYSNTSDLFVIHDLQTLPRVTVEEDGTLRNLSIVGDATDYATAYAPIIDSTRVGVTAAHASVQAARPTFVLTDTNVLGYSGNTAGIKGVGGSRGVLAMFNVNTSQISSALNGINGPWLDFYLGTMSVQQMTLGGLKCTALIKINSGSIAIESMIAQGSDVNATNVFWINGGSCEVGSIVMTDGSDFDNGIYINSETYNFEVGSGHIHGQNYDIYVEDGLTGAITAIFKFFAQLSFEKIRLPSGNRDYFKNITSIVFGLDAGNNDDFALKGIGELNVGTSYAPKQLVVGEGDSTVVDSVFLHYNGADYTNITSSVVDRDTTFSFLPGTGVGNAIYIGNTQRKFLGIKVNNITQSMTGNTGSPSQEVSTFQITVANITNANWDGQYIILYNNTGKIVFWFDIGNTGTAQPVVADTIRYVEINTLNDGDTAATAANVIAAVINNDVSFNAVSDGVNKVTITDVNTGTRQDISITAPLDNEADVAVIQQGSDFNVVYEYWNGSAWTTFFLMVSGTSAPYNTYDSDIFGREGGISEQIRFSGLMNDDWATTDVNGTVAYWVKFEVQTAITRVPQLKQIKLHTNRGQVNEDGFYECFGIAEPRRDISLSARYDVDNLATTSATVTIQGLAVSIPFATLSSSSREGFARSASIPHYTDTSKYFEYYVNYYVDGTQTGVIELVLDVFLLKKNFTLDQAQRVQQKKLITVSVSQDKVFVTEEFKFYLPSALIDDEIILVLTRDGRASNTADTLNANVIVVGTSLECSSMN